MKKTLIIIRPDILEKEAAAKIGLAYQMYATSGEEVRIIAKSQLNSSHLKSVKKGDSRIIEIRKKKNPKKNKQNYIIKELKCP